MRYHSCLFAYLRNIPFLALNYHRKISDLILDIKYSKNYIINLNGLANQTNIFNSFFNDCLNKEVNKFDENQQIFWEAPVETLLYILFYFFSNVLQIRCQLPG